jgi:hypothetical protein
MSDSASASAPPVTLKVHFVDGTLFVTPNAGNGRFRQGSTIVFTPDDVEFTVQFAVLTGGSEVPTKLEGKALAFRLPTVADCEEAPSYKYSIVGSGKAAGRVLDPIIIVDKHN